MTIKNVSSALLAFSQGAIVVVTDDADREHEGDLVMAAVHCSPAAMAFIIRHSSGIVCTPLTASKAARLKLPLMMSENDAPLGTAFTVSVDALAGLTTGIAAQERSNTARALATGDDPMAFVRPGHVFSLIARDGGVLERPGPTEAGVDLCRLAELRPVAVIGELVNDDGSVMKITAPASSS